MGVIFTNLLSRHKMLPPPAAAATPTLSPVLPSPSYLQSLSKFFATHESWVLLCMYIHKYIYIHTYIYVCICMCTYVCLCVCIVHPQRCMWRVLTQLAHRVNFLAAARLSISCISDGHVTRPNRRDIMRLKRLFNNKRKLLNTLLKHETRIITFRKDVIESNWKYIDNRYSPIKF